MNRHHRPLSWLSFHFHFGLRLLQFPDSRLGDLRALEGQLPELSQGLQVRQPGDRDRRFFVVFGSKNVMREDFATPFT
jgi:hypothetical protein